jgi:hypothetical protein
MVVDDTEPLDDDYEEQGDQYEVATLIRRMTSIQDPVMRRRQLQRRTSATSWYTPCAAMPWPPSC